MKIDPHKFQQRYKNWKKKGKPLEGISRTNRKLILQYLDDMEMGYNVGSQRGARGYARLCNLKQRMSFMANKLQEIYGKKDIRKTEEKEIIKFFNEMRNGKIKARSGKNYASVADYIWVFKAFWHWYMKVSKKEGKAVLDITVDLDTRPGKEPEYVFMNEKQMRRFLDQCKYDYKVLGYFCYDTGIRAPTELMNIRVHDLHWDEKEKMYTLTISDEASKTFGRKIKLLICSKELKNYIESKRLRGNDVLFAIVPRIANQYYRRVLKRVFPREFNKKSKGGELLKNFTLYDFRHNSACYWIPRYKNESGLKYRFGWKKNTMIYYYTKMLGHRDTITKDDLFIDTTKTELEQQLSREQKSRKILEDKFKVISKQLQELEKASSQRKKGDELVSILLERLKSEKDPRKLIKITQNMHERVRKK